MADRSDRRNRWMIRSRDLRAVREPGNAKEHDHRTRNRPQPLTRNRERTALLPAAG
jgi:hypothetical protein